MTWKNPLGPWPTEGQVRAVWRPLLFSLVLLATTIGLWRGLLTQEKKAIAGAVSQELAWSRETIFNEVNYYIATAQRMAERWAFYGDGHRDEWEYDAQHDLQQRAGWVDVAWVDESYQARYTVSARHNEFLGDIGTLLKENYPDAIAQVKETGLPQFSGIIYPKSGGERALLVTPLFVGDHFSGVLVDVLDVNVILKTVLKMSVDAGWVYHFREGRREVRVPAVAAVDEKWSQVATLQIPGVSIELTVTPGPAVLKRVSTHLSLIVLIIGLVLTAVSTWGVWSAQTAKIKSDDLRAATGLLRQIREALDSSALVSVTDVSGIITYTNDNFCRISKYSREELLGQNHRIIKSGLHPKEYYVDMWRTIVQGNVWKGEFCNKAKDGSLYWVYATIFPFLGEDGKPESYMGIRHDITDRKKIELALAEQSEELRRSNAALGEFDHVVAHELKTPLTVIKMAAENLVSAGLGPLNQIQENVVGMIDKNVDQLVVTINTLLKLAQLGMAGSGVAVHNMGTKRHVGSVIQSLQPVARERNIVLREEIQEGFPDVKGSPEVFSEVLSNLIGNAIRYAAREVVVEARAIPKWIQFSVRDDGPGIPKELHPRLFEKFSSDNKSQSPMFRGNGLGLYICKGLVSHMGGKIWVESDEVKGTCFYFTLPMGRPEAPTTVA